MEELFTVQATSSKPIQVIYKEDYDHLIRVEEAFTRLSEEAATLRSDLTKANETCRESSEIRKDRDFWFDRALLHERENEKLKHEMAELIANCNRLQDEAREARWCHDAMDKEESNHEAV